MWHNLDQESKFLIILGTCFVVGGIILVVLASVWHHEFERGGPGLHAAPRDEPKPEPPADATQALRVPPPARHRYEDLPGSQTTRLVPPDAPRGTVSMGGATDGEEEREAREPEGVHSSGPEARVREAEEAVREDDRGEDSERGDHSYSAVAYGEEGSAYTETQGRTVIAGWYLDDNTGEWFRAA